MHRITWSDAIQKGNLRLHRFSAVLPLPQAGKALCEEKEETSALARRLSDELQSCKYQRSHLRPNRFKEERVPVDPEAAGAAIFETRPALWFLRLQTRVRIAPVVNAGLVPEADCIFSNSNLRRVGPRAFDVSALNGDEFSQPIFAHHRGAV